MKTIGFMALMVAAVLACGLPGHAAEIEVVTVPAGPFISGSDRAERDYAYKIDEQAYGHTITRDNTWYENDLPRAERSTGAFAIMKAPVTVAQYAEFIAETGHPAPQVSRQVWDSYRLIHPYERTLKFQWTGGKPPEGRMNHPVTMVSYDDARAYVAWLAGKTGLPWRLPAELEWEKAMRGTDGRYFPWGREWDASRLNSHDMGPFDTVPVGSHPAGASPYGATDAAGQVFEWVSDSPAEGRHYVKGGSWDDKGCGVCRPAQRHGRPDAIKHILIGFRLVYDMQ
ncbi:MAG: SUMF1/EgtB/PvdO family nonheme iron enzyme [Rhodobiaceae bacterium]|nr:SUMF1/EgtB/PvdO family nonheme iron enzyme [Rhodobiaceae bacterium]MCC0060912.1 SUMF1/EgtB/PvdO family nonheme iron enzyme [Rhodobiaceae bacterium]